MRLLVDMPWVSQSELPEKVTEVKTNDVATDHHQCEALQLLYTRVADHNTNIFRWEQGNTTGEQVKKKTLYIST